MTSSVSEGSDRRTALRRMIGMATVPTILTNMFGTGGLSFITPAHAAANPGAQPNQGDLAYLPGASAPTRMIAEWFTGDVDNTGGPFRIASSKAAFEKAPANAARYEAKLYNFPSGSLRTMTFKKGGPIQHLITMETEIYIISGSATLTPIPGHPGKPVTVKAGDALFLPSGYLNSPMASEDFVILQAFVSRTVREAKKSIVTPKQTVTTEIAEWNGVRTTKPDEVRKAPKNAHRVTTTRYQGEGNSIRIVTLRGGPSIARPTAGSDLLVYFVKGRVRRKEGNQTFDLVAGDCMRQILGTPGSWEPAEETVCLCTQAPLNPDMLPPANT